MSDSPAGKGDKNLLKGDSLKKYGESKLWDHIDKKKRILQAIEKPLPTRYNI